MRNIWILVAMAALSACAGKQVKEEPMTAPQVIAQPEAKSAPEAAPASAQTSGVTEKKMEVNPLTDPGSILSRRSIYFDFDEYEIKPEYRQMIEAHAKYLAAHPQASLTLQGNADERGSHEYNLALGQKRAVAVKQMMNLLGVQDRQIETVSYGEEKPRVMGHDEMSWAENRRVDIVYQGE